MPNSHFTIMSKLFSIVRVSSLLAIAVLGFSAAPTLTANELSFEADVQPIFNKYCAGCHNEKEAESEFRADSLEGVLKGSKKGAIVQAGDSKASRIFALISGNAEPKMPPEEEPQPNAKEIDIIKRWVDAGAKGTSVAVPLREKLKSLQSKSTFDGKLPITSFAILGNGSTVAVGRYGKVDILDIKSQATKATVDGLVGKVTSLRVSNDGTLLAIASGVAGVGGQISIVDLSTSKLVQQIEGHRDTLYTAVISPDKNTLASAGYDRRIHLWDLRSGKLLRSLDGHNGAIYDLDFDPTGTVLASSSADETVKLWRVDTGLRLDTLGQPEAEQYTVRFSPDGKYVLAGGADRRIRMWKIASKSVEAISPLNVACFAHEKSVLLLRFSPDGKWVATVGEEKTIKLWTADSLAPVAELGTIDDIPSDAAWHSDGNSILSRASVETFRKLSPPIRFAIANNRLHLLCKANR